MRLKNEWTVTVASLAIFGLLMVAVTLPGCSDTAEKKSSDAAKSLEAAKPLESADPKEPVGTTPPEPDITPTPPEPGITPTPPEPDITPTPPEPDTTPTPPEPDTTPPPEPDTPPATAAADVPAVSKFAPAKDLAPQIDSCIKDLERATETEEDYTDSVDKISRNAATLAVIAVALGLHDEENAHKASAGTLFSAAGELAAASDFASAKVAVAGVKAAVASQEASDLELKWEKAAKLSPLMTQVPLLNSKLKRALGRFDSKADDAGTYSAALAVIFQGSIASADETIEPGQAEAWIKLATQARDGMAEINAQIHAGDADAAKATIGELDEATCTACHDIFKPEEEE